VNKSERTNKRRTGPEPSAGGIFGMQQPMRHKKICIWSNYDKVNGRGGREFRKVPRSKEKNEGTGGQRLRVSEQKGGEDQEDSSTKKRKKKTAEPPKAQKRGRKSHEQPTLLSSKVSYEKRKIEHWLKKKKKEGD